MNPMFYSLMKLAALLAMLSLSAGPLQQSTCKCEHCQATAGASITSTGPTAERCCCCTDSTVPRQSCPCGCGPALRDQGLEPRSELPSKPVTAERIVDRYHAPNSMPFVATAPSHSTRAGAAVCVVFCRFRL